MGADPKKNKLYNIKKSCGLYKRSNKQYCGAHFWPLPMIALGLRLRLTGEDSLHYILESESLSQKSQPKYCSTYTVNKTTFLTTSYEFGNRVSILLFLSYEVYKKTEETLVWVLLLAFGGGLYIQ